MAKKKKFNERHQRNLRDDHSRMSNHSDQSFRNGNVNHLGAKSNKGEDAVTNRSKMKKKQVIKKHSEGLEVAVVEEKSSHIRNDDATNQRENHFNLIQNNDYDDINETKENSTVFEQSFSPLDRTNSKNASNRQNFKTKDKKSVRNKYYHSKQNKSRKESASSHRLEKNDKKSKAKKAFKIHESKEAAVGLKGVKDSKVSGFNSKNNEVGIGGLSDHGLSSTKNSKKSPKDRHKQKKKIVNDLDKAQKAEKLKQKPSKKSNLFHTGKDIHYKLAYTSHKMDQFENRKESDENVAVMAADDGVDLVRNHVKIGSNKRPSKLQFEKSPKGQQVGLKSKTRSKATSNKAKGAKSSKAIQKKNIKKQYSKVVNTQVSDVRSRIKYTLKKVKDWAVGALKKMAIYMIGPVCIFVVAAVMILSVIQSFSSGVSTVISTSYQSSDIDVTNSHLIYTGLEADLKYAIENVEDDYSEYDEFRYDLDSIGHDMHLIVAYLTAKFGDFSPSDVRSELNSIFNEQYDYTLTRIVEVRYRTVWHSSYDPVSGYSSSWSTQEPYDWFVLKVKLETKNLETIILSRMDDDEKDLYEALVDTKGNFMSMPSPFIESWKHNISSHFGYRLDPVSKEVTFHQGIDIAKPIGTELISIIEGQVSKVGYDGNGYGHYVEVKTKTDESILYGHCSSILVNEGDEVEVGETIALVGSSGKSTGPHVHLEIRDSSGNKLNPYFYLTEE